MSGDLRNLIEVAANAVLLHAPRINRPPHISGREWRVLQSGYRHGLRTVRALLRTALDIPAGTAPTPAWWEMRLAEHGLDVRPEIPPETDVVEPPLD
ncbi:hypothetical protein BH11PLA2_BH11PLA2_34440 [soil metagenome]